MQSRSKKRLLTTLFVVLAIGLLLPLIYSLRDYFSDAKGLVLIASDCDTELGLNPHNWVIKKLLRPTALWILLNTDYPYRIHKTGGPDLINAMVNLDQCMRDNGTGYELIQHFIERGEPVNNYWLGFTPLISSVMFEPDYRLTKILLDAGADPYQTLQFKESELYGMNTFEIADNRMTQFPDDYSAIFKLLQAYKSKSINGSE